MDNGRIFRLSNGAGEVVEMEHRGHICRFVSYVNGEQVHETERPTDEAVFSLIKMREAGFDGDWVA